MAPVTMTLSVFEHHFSCLNTQNGNSWPEGLTIRFDMGAFCDLMVRKIYVDENRFQINAVASS